MYDDPLYAFKDKMEKYETILNWFQSTFISLMLFNEGIKFS